MDEEPQEIATQWQIRTLAHAYQKREPTRYVVEGYLSEGSLNILYGPPAAMKSMLLADLCACVVAGSDWLPGTSGNGRGIKTNQAPVFWVDMDNGTRRTDERIDAVSRAHKLPEDAPFNYVSMPMPPLNVADLDMMIYLKGVIRELGAKLTIIDNLGLITGEIEENSAAMAMVMGYLRQIAEGTGTAMVVIHHQRKGGANGGRAGDALRGHSSIEAAIDLALHAVREANSNQVSLRSTKTRGVDVPNAVMEFSYEHVPGTNDLSNAYFTSVAVRQNSLLLKQALLSFAEGNSPRGIPKNRLRELVYEDLGGEFSHGKIRAEMEHLVEVTGELDIIEGRQGAKLVVIGRGNGGNDDH